MIDDNWGNGGPACCGPDSRMLLAVAAWLLMPLFRARGATACPWLKIWPPVR
jgi:hypothetical protein